MKPFIQVDFILFLDGKKPFQLKTILDETITEAIETFKDLYEYDFKNLRSKIDLYKSKGYEFQQKINLCIDLLSNNEPNEGIRLKYIECNRHTFDLNIFISSSETEYKIRISNELATIEKHAKLLHNGATPEMCHKFLETIEKINKMDEDVILQSFNHRVNAFLCQMIIMKSTMNKEHTNDF